MQECKVGILFTLSNKQLLYILKCCPTPRVDMFWDLKNKINLFSNFGIVDCTIHQPSQILFCATSLIDRSTWNSQTDESDDQWNHLLSGHLHPISSRPPFLKTVTFLATTSVPCHYVPAISIVTSISSASSQLVTTTFFWLSQIWVHNDWPGSHHLCLSVYSVTGEPIGRRYRIERDNQLD